jgi:hypothetical protein
VVSLVIKIKVIYDSAYDYLFSFRLCLREICIVLCRLALHYYYYLQKCALYKKCLRGGSELRVFLITSSYYFEYF